MLLKTFYQNAIVKFLLLSVLIISTVSFTACNSEDDATSNITTDEAAAIMEIALAKNSEGLAKAASDAAMIALDYTQKTTTDARCGETNDSTFTKSINNAQITATYTTSLMWKLNCTNLRIPTFLDYDRSTTGEYETNRISSDDNAVSDWTIGNLVSGAAWTINGTYKRTGSQTLSVREQHSLTSELTMNVNSINVNKSTMRIDSGNATFKLTGNTSEGNSFTFEGNIIFNGNGTATVTINGQTFEIPLN